MHTPVTAIRQSERPDEQSISLEAYKRLFGSHPGAVTVVTACHEGGPVGFTATSVISLSAAPPLLAFSVSRQSSSYRVMQRVAHAAVHFLDVAAEPLASRFATSGIDRFAGLECRALPDGTPLIDQVQDWAWGTIAHRFEVDGAMMVVLHIQQACGTATRSPLLYQNRLYQQLSGPAPVTA